ncbi:hypothetical protein D3C87_1173330 [compost metagenome]
MAELRSSKRTALKSAASAKAWVERRLSTNRMEIDPVPSLCSKKPTAPPWGTVVGTEVVCEAMQPVISITAERRSEGENKVRRIEELLAVSGY